LAAAFGFGVLAAASMQPLLFWPVLLVSIPVLIWLLDGIAAERSALSARALRAFLTGWSFGFGYFLASLHWIGQAFLVDAATYAWMMPIAVAGLPAGMALYLGVAAGLAILVWTPGLRRLLFFAALLSLAEWLRGHLFTGFPWNSFGYAAEAIDGIAQLAAFLGIWGLTFLVILWSSLPALLGEERLSLAQRMLAIAIALSPLPLWVIGIARLDNAGPSVGQPVMVRIVQPNVPQSDKWRSENASRMFSDLLAMSSGRAAVDTADTSVPAYVIWPESSLPFLIDEQPAAMKEIAAALGDETVLLMGSLRRSPLKAALSQARVYNSLFVIGGGEIRAVYDKAHLVPYGEYLPLEDWLEPLGFRRLVTIPGSFTPGAGPATLPLGSTPAVSPLICYEAIFPGRVASARDRPGWLLNITNDGWFGQSSGPYQHLAQARFRSIEEGLPLLRAANTGISAVIDAHGRIIRQLPLGEKGVIDSILPQAILAPPYARIGDWGFFLMVVAAAAIGLTPGFRKRVAARI
jgi:apolipoprotein N-acyltransferase